MKIISRMKTENNSVPQNRHRIDIEAYIFGKLETLVNLVNFGQRWVGSEVVVQVC